MINLDNNQDLDWETMVPKAKGLIGFLVLDKTGLLYFSKVKKNRINLAENIFQIAGFISALLIYSQDLIGEQNAGLKHKDINLGDYHMFFKTRDNIIFAYIVEKYECTENIEECMKVVIEKFLNTYYYSHLVEFKGDLSPFNNFEIIIDRYFEM
ncbi:MAG: hypothetical protein ACFE94_02100 [Candidatus Hodarchaeota archaeon]